MRFILNVIWLLFGGVFMAIGYAFLGLVLCVTIVGVPFGVQLFKIAGYVLWPFGRTVVKTGEIPGLSTVGNLLWLPVGFFLALGHLVSAFFCAITIIGLPFAVAHMKMVGLSLTPFGRTVFSDRELAAAIKAHRVNAADVIAVGAARPQPALEQA